MKIYLLHRHRYWSEYLDFLLDDGERFAMVRSANADASDYKGRPLAPFDPKVHKTLLTAGLFDDRTENNLVIFRSQHSPGFYVLPQIIGYKGFKEYHPTATTHMYLLESHYRALAARSFDHPAIDAIRYEMLSDPNVKTMPADLSLYRIKEAPKRAPRQEGTLLLSLRWIAQYVEVKKIEELLKFLSRELAVSLLIHPCCNSLKWRKAMRAFKGGLLRELYENIPRDELIPLYDRHEFIATDGSGTCYEALLRGCKPLAIRDLYSAIDPANMAMEMLYDQLEEEFFPFPSYLDLYEKSIPTQEPFIRKVYPFLTEMSKEEAMQQAKGEILSHLENLAEGV